MDKNTETTVPLFPSRSLDATLDFYQALGFEVGYRQDEPYLYAAVSRGGIQLHFSRLSTWGSKGGVCLVFVGDAPAYHRRLSDALRARYGRIPTAGLPRMTRLAAGQTRFHVFDPDGNILLFIDHAEQDQVYEWSSVPSSNLAQALENAAFLRDTYANDRAAAQVLDKALSSAGATVPLDRARALACRAELAVVMGENEQAQALLAELEQIPLEQGDREKYQFELDAPYRVERWIHGAA